MSRSKREERIQELLAAKDEATKPAGEVIAHLYQALLSVPELRLSDGTTAKVEAYFEPEIDEDGRAHCGVDVQLSDGSMLEFTLRNTGWGKSFIQDAMKKRDGQGPAR
jgi:hypothetical protein